MRKKTSVHRTTRAAGCILAVLLASGWPLGPVVASGDSFDLHVPFAPRLHSVEGTNALVYELHLSNFAQNDLAPRRIEVLDAADGRVLAAYEGEALGQHLDRSGLQWKAEAYDAIPSGRRGVLFVELRVPGAPPRALRHRVGYAGASADDRVLLVEGGTTPVVSGATPVLGPPLRGGPWVAVYDARWARGHRRVGYALDGRLRTPGRHAVDWVKLDRSGRKSPPGSELAEQTYSHGEDVLAVADGIVVHVRDATPQRVRLQDPITRRDGNSVVLALADGRFAHYGHLRPGSATVTEGMRIHAGDKIAEVGFSGSASDPQLHFALTDGPEELASEGLAYTFERYVLLGRYDEVARIGSAWPPAGSEQASRRSMPAALSVLRWPE